MKKIKVSKKKLNSALIFGGITLAGICCALIIPQLFSNASNKIEQVRNRSGFAEAPEELKAVYQKNEENKNYKLNAEISVYGNDDFIVRETGTYVFEYTDDCTQKIKDDTRDEIGYRYFDPLHKEERIVEEWNENTLTITFDLSYRDGTDMITKTLLRIYENDAPSMGRRIETLHKEGFREVSNE